MFIVMPAFQYFHKNLFVGGFFTASVQFSDVIWSTDNRRFFMSDEEPVAEFVKMLDAFPLFSTTNRSLPLLSESAVVLLIEYVQNIFTQSPMCLDISGEFVTIGDLHGRVFDLMRILERFGMPPHRNYLLLGDYVDRGDFSLETIILIYLLKAIYPSNVYVVRGNHEVYALCSQFGFRDEVQSVYRSQLVFNAFVKSFGFMPIAARVNGDVFCVHGGIGPHTTTIDTILSVPRPIVEFDRDVVEEVLWSDPSSEIEEFQPSKRGSGVVFGRAALNRFLEQNHLRMLVRGHQSIEEGVLFQIDGKVVTVFSASNYAETPNPSGVLLLKPDGEESFKIDAVDVIGRGDVEFKSLDAKAKGGVSTPFADSNDVRRIRPTARPGGLYASVGRKSMSISAKAIGSVGSLKKRTELAKRLG